MRKTPRELRAKWQSYREFFVPFIIKTRARCLKYRNGGCPGLEPDFLLIYSVYNFSNRIPKLYEIFNLLL